MHIIPPKRVMGVHKTEQREMRDTERAIERHRERERDNSSAGFLYMHTVSGLCNTCKSERVGERERESVIN